MNKKSLTILIPTYNRFLKFRKTLKTYSAMDLKTRIVVLDGSNFKTHKKNKDFSEKINLNIVYKYFPDDSLTERLINELNNYNNDDLICLGNDEDVYTPEYLENGSKFLINNPTYSVYIGRYLTHQKKIFGFNRISYWRDTYCDVDIDLDSPFRRLMLLQRIINGGCSPIFWGIRKAEHILNSLIIQERIIIENTQELADIIYCAYVGKIRFVNEIMIWRDEMALKLDEHPTRTDLENFIDITKREELINAFKDFKLFTYDEQIDSFLDWYFKKINKERNNSFNIILHQKSYSRLENSYGLKTFNIIIFLDKLFKIFNELLNSLFWNIRFIKQNKYKAYRIFKK